MIRAAILAIGRPITLATNGHGARGARIDFEDVDLAVLQRILHVHQAADFKRQRHSCASASSSRSIVSGLSERGGNEQALSPE